MKKLVAGIFVLAVVLVPFAAIAGTGYYNMAIMDTAQALKGGKFVFTAADDAGFWYSDFSKKWLMENEATGRLSYYIIEGLEAAASYNHAFYTHPSTPMTNAVGNGQLDMRYAFGLGDLVKLSLGLGLGVPIDKTNGAITFTNSAVFQFVPEACLSANFGGLNLHVQLKDRMLMSDPDMQNWVQIKGAIAFDFNGFLAAFTGGFDTFTGMPKASIIGGPEIIWNMGGPLQINIGLFADTNYGAATAYRGVFRLSILP